jgi:hypothetical protein
MDTVLLLLLIIFVGGVGVHPSHHPARLAAGAHRPQVSLKIQMLRGWGERDSIAGVIAMATKAQIKFTYEDYKSLPYSERQRFELLEES